MCETIPGAYLPDTFSSASVPVTASHLPAFGGGAMPVTSGNMSDAFGSTAVSTHYITILSNRSMPANTSMPGPLRPGTGWRRCDGSTGAAVCRCSAPASAATDTVVLSDPPAVLLPADGTTSLPAGDDVQLPDLLAVLLPAFSAPGFVPAYSAVPTFSASGLVPAYGAAVPLPAYGASGRVPAGDVFAGLPDDSRLPATVDTSIDSMWMGTTAWRTWTSGWWT